MRTGFEGSQDYELLLRFTDGLRPDEITHVPFPAYHWRRHRKSFSSQSPVRATDSARLAIAGHYQADATVEPALVPDLHRVRFRSLPGRVSVIIPTRDGHDLLSRVVDGLIHRTDHPDLEIVVVDNGSTDPRLAALYDRLLAGRPGSRIVRDASPFNFSRLVNRGIAAATGDSVLLLNNDVEILAATWLTEMIECLAFRDVGIVGARLLYPGGTLQHAGVIVGLGRYAGHWYVERPGETPGPMNRLRLRQSLSAVTGACMLVTRACLDAVGPFDEERFAIAYNDVDFCLRARRAGFRIVWTPNATLVHHESATRGSDEAPDKVARFLREKDALENRHATSLFEDPAFNPWYSRDRAVPHPVPVPSLPAPR